MRLLHDHVLGLILASASPSSDAASRIMLSNGRALLSLINDRSYDRKIAGRLHVFQGEKWRSLYGILKANLLFVFENEESLECPLILLVIEDCVVELADDNLTGKPFSFSIRFKTTGRTFQMAAESFEALGNWISCLTVSSMDYMSATKQSLLAQISEPHDDSKTSH